MRKNTSDVHELQEHAPPHVGVPLAAASTRSTQRVEVVRRQHVADVAERRDRVEDQRREVEADAGEDRAERRVGHARHHERERDDPGEAPRHVRGRHRTGGRGCRRSTAPPVKNAERRSDRIGAEHDRSDDQRGDHHDHDRDPRAEHRDHELREHQPPAADRAHQQVAQVAPARFAGDGVTAEEGDDDHEHERARDAQREAGEQQPGLRREVEQPARRRACGSGGLRLIATAMMIGISTRIPYAT